MNNTPFISNCTDMGASYRNDEELPCENSHNRNE
ncbi:Uncharacterised protein [Vibrio cholerae]|nr:Uncharacterised protein [Vibrio cholerae]